MGINKDPKSSKSAAQLPTSPATDSSKENAVCDNCAPSSASSTNDSSSCLTNQPNIHINHIYVYNFSPESQTGRNSTVFETPIRSNKYQSPAASSGPICRICHEGDIKEDLVSPCRCTGTVGLVHKACMERWLSTRCNAVDKCEICNYAFITARSPKSLLEWIRSEENDGNHRRSLVGDVTCFLLLTPLAIVSSFLCVEGAKKQVIWGNSLEAGCLMALATFLITIYFVWNVLTLRYHLKAYFIWRSRNQNVKLLRVQRISAVENSESNLQGIQIIPHILESDLSPSVTIPIPDLETNGLPTSF